MNKAYSDPRINNVVTGLHSHCYGLGLNNEGESVDYQLHYINGDNELTGNLIKLNLHSPERDSILLAFCMHISETFRLDVLETFNTYQDATRSMAEQLGYLTIKSNDLLPYKDKKPTIVTKHVKGVIMLPFLYHADLYQWLFGGLRNVERIPGATYVYLMHNKRNNLIKIGKSVNPSHREKTLQAEEPEINMIAVWEASPRLETHLHRLYKHKRLRGEWFDLNFKELKEVKKHVETFAI
jgi:hypothetical protein